MAAYKKSGLSLPEFTTTQLTTMVTNYGPTGSVTALAIKIGTLVRDTTTKQIKLYNGTTFAQLLASPSSPVPATVLPSYTTSALATMVTAYGSAGNVTAGALVAGTVVYDTTTLNIKVFNGTAFVVAV